MPLNLILFILFMCSLSGSAQAAPAVAERYHANRLYCEEDGDCAIREGACGPEIMNVHFDNSELVALQSLVKCALPDPPAGPLKCLKHVCRDTAANANNAACPEDARLCPDGTAVGRIGPDCEFRRCPGGRDQHLADEEPDKLSCVTDMDCAVREGACGGEVMNIYFDNSKLIAMRPTVECAETMVYKNVRCEDRRCVADSIPQLPKAEAEFKRFESPKKR